MKFEILDNKGVLQPIEFILATIALVTMCLITTGVFTALDIYFPWWSEESLWNNGTILLLFCYVLIKR